MASNPTIRYLKESEGDEAPPARWDYHSGFAPPHREPIVRLAWGPPVDKFKCSYDNFSRSITFGALPSSIFLLDTGFITSHEVPQSVWSALRRHHVVIPPLVLRELDPWMRNPRCNRRFRDDVVRRITRFVSRLEFLDFTRLPWQVHAAIKYYATLLYMRKEAGFILRDDLADKLGRQPTDAELAARSQKMLRDRGWRIAKKAVDAGDPKRPTDEELVATALVLAIGTGREVHILTRDTDVLDQFYKCIYLMDVHYRSTLIADRFAECPWQFPRFKMRPPPNVRGLYLGDDNLLIGLPPNFAWDVLPQKYHWVISYCWLFSTEPEPLTLSRMHFNLEMEMARTLDAKAMTRGLNTSRLGGKNCHEYVDPINQLLMGQFAGITTDDQRQIGDVWVSDTDVEMAILQVERVSREESTKWRCRPKESAGEESKET